MATKKTKRSRTRTTTLQRQVSMPPEMHMPVSTEPAMQEPPQVSAPRRPWGVLIPAVLLIIAFLAWFNRGMFIAAVVNGQPIFRWDFTRVLEDRFGKQTLEGMISEKLIADAAMKSGVTVSRADLDAKITEIVENVGKDVSLDELLSFQGLTRSDFENQVQLQLTVERVLGKDIVVSEGDIDNFIATNRATLRATDPAKLRDEAKQTIIERGVSEKLQGWFAELRKNAQIEKFIQ